MKPKKPLGHKGYGHIPHLPGSRMGPGDHMIHEGQARICTEKVRNKHDEIFVTEKLDGSNVCVAKINGEAVPITRAGYHCFDSNFRQHHLFAAWVVQNYSRFDSLLDEGERIIGEWLAMAHGTRYNLPHEPFVVFDLMAGHDRVKYDDFIDLIGGYDFIPPHLIHRGGPFSISDVIEAIAVSHHGALDPVEGAVWRVENHEKVDFLAKYVRPDKEDGKYIDFDDDRNNVWNWKPQ